MKIGAFLFILLMGPLVSVSQVKLYMPLYVEAIDIDSVLIRNRYPIQSGEYTCYVLMNSKRGSGEVVVYKKNIKLIKCIYAEGDVLCKEACLGLDLITGKWTLYYRNYYYPKILSYIKYNGRDSTMNNFLYK